MTLADIDVVLGVIGHSPDTKVVIDGQDITGCIQGIEIDAGVVDMTRVVLKVVPNRLAVKLNRVNVTAVIGGLDPAEMIEDVTRLLGRQQPRTTDELDDQQRWVRVLNDLAATLAAGKGA